MRRLVLLLLAPAIFSACEHEIDMPRPKLGEGMCEYYESGFGSYNQAYNRMQVVQGIFENPNIGGGTLSVQGGQVYQTEESYTNFLFWQHIGVSREYGFQFQFECGLAQFTTYSQRGFANGDAAALGLKSYLDQLIQIETLDTKYIYKILNQYTSSYADGQSCYTYYTTDSKGKRTSHRSCRTIYHYSFTVVFAKINKSNPSARQAEVVNASLAMKKFTTARMTTVDALELGQKMGEYLGLDAESSSTLKQVTEKYREAFKTMNDTTTTYSSSTDNNGGI